MTQSYKPAALMGCLGMQAEKRFLFGVLIAIFFATNSLAERLETPRLKPLECYKANASWNIFYVTLGASTGLFFGSFLFMPAVLKGFASFINYANEIEVYDAEFGGFTNSPRYPCLGPCLLTFTDDNGDGKVDASELLRPQTVFGTISFTVPLIALNNAIAAQAECDYALAKEENQPLQKMML